ncbi:hypothetical protein PoB_006906200 [Plakobranchus ocellatus]|uniref:Uncharacterized protein n=1 Tax=Plakobranchus ocellatus TaxID=259542 RepID=A0AAV4DE82_9GAST|nr:hypothetical protein PoB_006906200 [Plakobranchus ocellatus]
MLGERSTGSEAIAGRDQEGDIDYRVLSIPARIIGTARGVGARIDGAQANIIRRGERGASEEKQGGLDITQEIREGMKLLAGHNRYWALGSASASALSAAATAAAAAASHHYKRYPSSRMTTPRSAMPHRQRIPESERWKYGVSTHVSNPRSIPGSSADQAYG